VGSGPIGSLYHFFPGGKEELAAETLRTAGAAYQALVEAVLDGEPDMRGAIRACFDGAGETLRATAQALELCGIADLAEVQAGALSTGQRRLVEMARACASGFRLVLFDEPSSGLDAEETERLGAILRGLVDGRGVGILLVEHDMTLVMDVCEHLFVLDFGTLVFEGTAAAAQTSDVVRAAYLGSESGLEAAESEHFADAAAGQAVDRCLEREPRGARRLVLGRVHPRSNSSTAAYGSSERSATRATAASRRDAPTRPASCRSSASRRSASTSPRAAARRRSR